MIKKLFFVFVFTIFYTSAQEFAPVGAKWIYSDEHLLPTPNNFTERYPDTLFVLGEEMYQGKLCKKIKGNLGGHLPDVASEEYHYVHQDQNQVYAYYSGLDTFQKIFDFDAQVGDSFKVYLDNGNWIDSTTGTLYDTVLVHIDSVYTELSGSTMIPGYTFSKTHSGIDYNGNYHKSTIHGYQANLHFGATAYLLPFYNMLYVCPAFIGERYLCMYIHDTDTVERTYNGLPSCTFNNIDVEEEALSTLRHWVVNNILYFDIDQELKTIEVISVTGKKILEKKNIKSIDLNSLNNSVYMIRVQTQDDRYKMIKLVR
jgi:hypothetical protein